MKSITSKKAARALPALRADANKYTRGVCELVVGSDRFVGAAVLAVSAANRMGAGYVKAYTCDKAADVLHIVQPSAVVLSEQAFFEEDHVFDERRPRAVVAGCGMAGTDEEIRRTLDLLEACKAPVVLDGGGLRALACEEGAAAARRRFVEGIPAVITPHGGEALRLMRFLAEGSQDMPDPSRLKPQEMALVLARAFGVTCVLKGPDTFIATGDEASAGDVAAMLQGTPALAKAGTGDILAGMIGSLISQGAEVFDACAAATFLHARAGMLASVDRCELCVTAEDVLDHIAAAAAALDRKIRKEGN